MTLTGTTPPTAQEGQQGFPGADSFNLAEAIADAGSWLQQSFDLNRDLRLCETSKSAPTSSAGTRRSAIGVDDGEHGGAGPPSKWQSSVSLFGLVLFGQGKSPVMHLRF
ncbi:hypothetical protein AARAC_000236 [Aspergillus arachidicola]|uniref:Uncharacterized protein n=1 Tax=Aspergillus arachidicola TaxID=656916 RepID=A0A2G7FR15_9EURO|nr:hypothetical protein AARAC_000236 [Aspergillus arachidicola]